MEIIAEDIKQLKLISEKIIEYADGEKVWLFKGELGAGKTTLIKYICKAFGVKDLVNSPTFSLVNEYRNIRNDIFFHLDFYRINDETEAMDIGADEYIYSDHYCFIEWPSKIPSLIPDKFLEINILVDEAGKRIFNLIKYE